MLLQTSSFTDIGKLRQNNEDSFLELDLPESEEKRLLLVVADGMGGHNAGEVASKTVVETIESYFKSGSQSNNSDTLNNLKKSLEDANRAVLKASSNNVNLAGMGSTCTAMMIVDDKNFLAHVGDSRAYMVRGNKITQITKDHTLAEKMLDTGILSREEARNSPHKNMLIKAIGISEDLEIETYGPFKIKLGDVYLLCSDGLTEYLDEEELCSILNMYEPEEACKLLIKIANKRGGKDNITVQVTKVISPDENKNSDVGKSTDVDPFKSSV